MARASGWWVCGGVTILDVAVEGGDDEASHLVHGEEEGATILPPPLPPPRCGGNRFRDLCLRTTGVDARGGGGVEEEEEEEEEEGQVSFQSSHVED